MYFFNWIPIRHKIFLASNICTSYISWREKEWRNNKMASIVLTLKICIKFAGFFLIGHLPYAMIFSVNTISAKTFLASCPFNKKCSCCQLFGPIFGFWDPLTLKIFLAYGYVIKKVHNILLYDTEQIYVKKQDGGWIKICEIFSGKSLKEGLSIDTTLTPVIFCETVPLRDCSMRLLNSDLFSNW